MKSRTGKKWRSTARILRRTVAWTAGIPLGWLVVKASYEWQHGWSERQFLIAYLLLYAFMAGAAMLVRTRHSELPEVTFWAVCVYPLVGLARITSQLQLQEFNEGAEISIHATLLATVLGTAALFAFMKWEQRKDRKTAEQHAGDTKTVRLVPIREAGLSREDSPWW